VDASHFTIRYKVEEHEGIIHGWLGDDDGVRLQAKGPWAMPPGVFTIDGKDVMAP
jgi:hypothetical protein